jgi:hypothetical protein
VTQDDLWKFTEACLMETSWMSPWANPELGDTVRDDQKLLTIIRETCVTLIKETSRIEDFEDELKRQESWLGLLRLGSP